jgi:hypothetical protein
MAKAHTMKNNGKVIGYMIECPACGCGHLFYTDHPEKKYNWTFNGDIENPTFSPSMLVHANTDYQKRCHSFVKNGKIEFLKDCEHSLAGKTVPLEDINW